MNSSLTDDTSGDIVLIWQECGADIVVTKQVSTVFNCYVPIKDWVSTFYKI